MMAAMLPSQLWKVKSQQVFCHDGSNATIVEWKASHLARLYHNSKSVAVVAQQPQVQYTFIMIAAPRCYRSTGIKTHPARSYHNGSKAVIAASHEKMQVQLL